MLPVKNSASDCAPFWLSPAGAIISVMSADAACRRQASSAASIRSLSARCRHDCGTNQDTSRRPLSRTISLADIRHGAAQPSYVGRVLRLTLLAPDIVEAILSGRQPADMTLAVLMRPFAVKWTEQRKTNFRWKNDGL
jgi:hypothetical protein